MIYELRKQIEYFLRNKIYMVSLIIAAVAGYGYEITHSSLGIDDVCIGLYLIWCVKIPLFRQNYGLSRRLCDSTGSGSEKIPSKLYFAGIFLLRI